MKSQRTWILIADGETARVIENTGPGKGVFQPAGKIWQAPEKIGPADREGRSINSQGSARHKMEPNTSGDKEAERFAKGLIEDLGQDFRSDHFDRLIICAAADMLGILRRLMPENLNVVVIAEVSKNLTHIPTSELSDHFKDVLAV